MWTVRCKYSQFPNGEFQSLSIKDLKSFFTVTNVFPNIQCYSGASCLPTFIQRVFVSFWNMKKLCIIIFHQPSFQKCFYDGLRLKGIKLRTMFIKKIIYLRHCCSYIGCLFLTKIIIDNNIWCEGSTKKVGYINFRHISIAHVRWFTLTCQLKMPQCPTVLSLIIFYHQIMANFPSECDLILVWFLKNVQE